MSIRQQIQDQIKQAMRDKNKTRLDALRFLWSEIKNAEIDAKMELDDQGIQAVINREVKKRKEVIEQMVSAARDELVGEEKAKLEVFMEYMPKQMSREELGQIVDEVKASLGESDFGKLMKEVMAKVKNQADGRTVSEVIKEKLA